MADVVKMTPQEEEMMIDNAYQNLLNGYLSSNHRKKVEIIEKAYKFAREAHKGVRRRSGEPYIMHPITVAQIVSQEIGLGSTSICAARCGGRYGIHHRGHRGDVWQEDCADC